MTTIIGIDAATQPKKIGLARGRLGADETPQIEEALLGSEVKPVSDVIVCWLREMPAL